jgi:Bacterial Ig-like domain
VHSTRPVPRRSSLHLRALVAVALALGLVLAIAVPASAALTVTIDSGPGQFPPTNNPTPLFAFTPDAGATTVECAIDPADQVTPGFGTCSGLTTHAPLLPLVDGDYVFRVRVSDGVDEQIAEQSFTVDTLPPSLSLDSGPSGPTNDNTPSFGFTAEARATVECSVDDGTPVYGSCTSSSSHTAAALADGSYVFHVRATDVAGNQTSASRVFSVDATPPLLSIDSGPSNATNVSTPSFGFTAEAGATTECSIDQGSAAYLPCGSPYAPAAPLPEGRSTFRVQATDAAGNVTTATRSFTVDTLPPSLSLDSGPSGPTNDNTPSFGFTAEARATVECSVDDGTPVYGSCTSSSSHTAAALADGSYVFHVRATDAAGNPTSASRAFSVDTVDPAVGVTSSPTITSDSTPSFAFTAEARATVQCSIDHGTPAFTSCTSPFTPAAPLPDGSYTFRVRATDSAGNQASDSQAFTVDSAAPSLTIDSGPPPATNDSAPSFGFTAEAGATVQCSVDQGTLAFAPCTSPFTPATALSDGTYTFSVRATDRAANVASETRTFTIDTSPPSLLIGFGPSGTTSDSTPLFGFTAELGATVECSIDQGTPAYGPCASATTHAAVAPLADGAYVFRVRATDRAGNQTTDTRAFTVDIAPPTPTSVSPRPDPTPPATTSVTPPPTALRLLSPFPLVRISGTLTSTGARISLLSVRAPRGALVRVTVSPACSRTRHASRRCRVLQAARTVGRHDLVTFRALARAYRSGTVIVVRVWRTDRIGKYTRFTIVRGKSPRRVDQCLVPAATRGSRCPNG